MNLLVTNGRVVDPSQRLDRKADVLIADATIAEVSRKVKSSADWVGRMLNRRSSKFEVRTKNSEFLRSKFELRTSNFIA
ncbi:MAG TPA: hypothetical protein VER58_02895 [Thermoanaerobaculia bacterium]|nr:hypothetical protein [Thermoanaerobaculia bacterium]